MTLHLTEAERLALQRLVEDRLRRLPPDSEEEEDLLDELLQALSRR